MRIVPAKQGDGLIRKEHILEIQRGQSTSPDAGGTKEWETEGAFMSRPLQYPSKPKTDRESQRCRALINLITDSAPSLATCSD